jgi:hypothetical protein
MWFELARVCDTVAKKQEEIYLTTATEYTVFSIPILFPRTYAHTASLARYSGMVSALFFL